MKVFLTGATGAIGPADGPRLLERATRSGGRPDGREGGAAARAGRRAGRRRPVRRDAVKAAGRGLRRGAPPRDQRAAAAQDGAQNGWATHNRLRTEATEQPRRRRARDRRAQFVKESVTFVYPDGGDAWIDESTPPDESIGLLRPTLEGERMVDRFTRRGRPRRRAPLRVFYGPTAPRHRRDAPPRPLAPLERGRQARTRTCRRSTPTTSPARSSPRSTRPAGIYNVVDDEPLTRREYLDAFPAAFGLPEAAARCRRGW